MRTRFVCVLSLASILTLVACGAHDNGSARGAATRAAATKADEHVGTGFDQLSREEFNLRAAERFLPLFWRADENADRTIQPSELSVLWGPQRKTRADYVNEQGYTPAFYVAYRRMLERFDDSQLDARERGRRVLVRQELRGGRPTLVETDLSAATEEDRQIAAHVFAAAVVLEQMHGRQLGTFNYLGEVPADDPSSLALFNRNQGPWCRTPQLEKNPACGALPIMPRPLSGLYPVEAQTDDKFCDSLAGQPNAKALMDHFSTVEKGGDGLRAVPYNVAYSPQMLAIAKELEAAAQAIVSPGEASFKAYLIAAAASFRSNDWEPSNEAWLKMSGSASRWYLRIAPDEVYYEPCAWKAGFAVSFARINPDSKMWQEKLEPVKEQMENALAQMAGAPYKARDVKFKLPDFIDIVLNAGDARPPHGATVGQSLPNWGRVAEKGGRTVAMTNLYTDADSRQALKRQMSSVFCVATNARATTDPKPATMSTVLHEAAHNLGPSHDYAISGKKDRDIFGGPLASTLEELKAQSSALYFSDWLVKKKLLTQAEAEEAHVRDIAWAFGHISRGMYEADGRPKNYSQLASIQLGSLWKAGALVWRPTENAASGGEQGCFEVDFRKWTPTIEALTTRVLKIKGKGDRKDAEALKAELVDASDEWSKLRDVVSERWLKTPKATFVYSVR